MMPSQPCPQCGKVFSCKGNLVHHQEIHNPDRKKTFTCLITGCDKSFYTKSELKLHTQNTHSTLQKYQCNLCEAKFKTQQGLNYHIIGFHCHEKAHQCDKCPKRFSHPSALFSHSFTHTDEKRFSCSICFKNFKQPGCLRSHIKILHEGTRFSCTQCHKYFNHKSNLRRHVKMTHETGIGSSFCCYFCGKHFNARSNLESHILTHTDEKPYFCSVPNCRFSSSHANALRQHKIRHLSAARQPLKKYWICYFCSKRMNSSNSLIVHLRSHTTETPFRCTLCRGSFRSKNSLTTHIFTHTMEKPFKCLECDKSFRTNTERLVHIASVHRNEKRFFCDICNYSSYYSIPVVNHRLSLHHT